MKSISYAGHISSIVLSVFMVDNKSDQTYIMDDIEVYLRPWSSEKVPPMKSEMWVTNFNF